MANQAGHTAEELRQAVIFYANFDDRVAADISGGQDTPDTRFNHPTEPGQFVFERGFDSNVFRINSTGGISGGALEAVDVLPNNGRIFFPARGNLPFAANGWGGALSVWCKTDPNTLFKTTFCDPIQITQQGANNGGLWFDFNNARPRDLRHGAFSAALPGQPLLTEDDPDAPMVRVPHINWQAADWHHVVMSWSGFDTGLACAVSQLYIDGTLIGTIQDREIAMRWDIDQTGIYVAVNYIGLLDELLIFRRPLTAEEIALLYCEPSFRP